MIDAIVRLSVERRYLMLSMILVLIGVGVWSFQRDRSEQLYAGDRVTCPWKATG